MMHKFSLEQVSGFFVFKKALSALLLPLPIALLLLIIGVLLLWLNRYQIVAKSFVTAGVLVLLVFGFSSLPQALLMKLENQYQPVAKLDPAIHTIVVLGGGVRGNTHVPPNTQLGASSLARLIEGVRLYELIAQRGQSARLILSGGRVFGSPSAAGKMRNTAVILGVKRQDIEIENGSQDTHSEAIYLKRWLKQQPFYLVTSAFHMPRAMMLFRAEGLHPVAAPTQYLALQNHYQMARFFPSALNLLHADVAIHEYLGIFWYSA